jgi:hypothetical protein
MTKRSMPGALREDPAGPKAKRPKEACKDCWAESKLPPEGGWAPIVAPGPRCQRHGPPPKRPKEVCKDCWVELEGVRPKAGWRPTVEGPGPRCKTHFLAARKARRSAAHGRRLEKGFRMPARLYWALYAFQGGKCFGCQVATGKTKRLAVDHDHECDAGHPPDQGCPRCWRALLCGQCNQIIGRIGIEALLRLVQVLAGAGPAKQLFVLEVIDDDEFDLGEELTDGDVTGDDTGVSPQGEPSAGADESGLVEAGDSP